MLIFLKPPLNRSRSVPSGLQQTCRLRALISFPDPAIRHRTRTPSAWKHFSPPWGQVPLSHFMQTILFANNRGPANRQQTFGAFKPLPNIRASCRFMLTNAGLPLSSATFCAFGCVSVVSAVLISPANAAPASPVARLAGLRGMHPSRQPKPCCQSVLLSSSGLPRSRTWPLPLPSAVVFSASAKMKEKNQCSKEGQEKSS